MANPVLDALKKATGEIKADTPAQVKEVPVGTLKTQSQSGDITTL